MKPLITPIEAKTLLDSITIAPRGIPGRRNPPHTEWTRANVRLPTETWEEIVGKYPNTPFNQVAERALQLLILVEKLARGE